MGFTAEQVRQLIREQAGLDLPLVSPARDGQSAAAFWVTGADGQTGLLKIAPGPAGAAVSYLHALDEMLGRLRDRAYPAARFQAIGATMRFGFWIQERLPGRPLGLDYGEPDYDGISRLLPDLFRLNDAQAWLGDGSADWAALISQTLTAGGDGYCLHATLEASPDTRDLLAALRRVGDSCCPAIPAAADFVHFDFHFQNLLHSADPAGDSITGVIDINPPLLAGDRAFDLATLLFYVYDHEVLRRRIGAQLLELAGSRVARAYLAHMVLRQVEWSVRNYPAAAATRHHLRLGRLIIDDISSPGGGLAGYGS